MLQKVIHSYPYYLPAYRNLGNIYTLQGSYSKAVTAYKVYLTGNFYSIDDLIHYASALFFNKQYADAAGIISEEQALDPNNFLLKHLSIYNSYETKVYNKGIEEMKTFFSNPKEKYIWQDNLYYARLLNKEKDMKKQLKHYKKQLSMQTHIRKFTKI